MRYIEPKKADIFETGLYTVGEVSRLTQVHPQRISRWTRGYSYRIASGSRSQEPVWAPETPRANGTVTLGFNDLLEIRFVDALRRIHKIPLSIIRTAVFELRKMLGERYPFSNRTVFLYGKKLITKLKDDNSRPLFVELSGGRQTLFYSMTLPALEKGLVFEEDHARRWYPDVDRYPRIVINPRVLFGTPVIEGTRLSAEFVSDAHKAEGSYDKVAYWYEIDTEAIRQAVGFHSSMRNRELPA